MFFWSFISIRYKFSHVPSITFVPIEKFLLNFVSFLGIFLTIASDICFIMFSLKWKIIFLFLSKIFLPKRTHLIVSSFRYIRSRSKQSKTKKVRRINVSCVFKFASYRVVALPFTRFPGNFDETMVEWEGSPEEGVSIQRGLIYLVREGCIVRGGRKRAFFNEHSFLRKLV